MKRKSKNQYEIGWYSKKPYHYQGKQGTLGRIISSEKVVEVLKENKTEQKKKKIEEQVEETK